jgi:glycosyltransferase involved in cell wall biosynthesis
MRIVIDMQGAQTESRYRGIGRYTLSFAKAVARNRGDHEVVLALNGLFAESIEPIRAAFDSLLPQENIRVWSAPGPVCEMLPGNEARRQSAEILREAFLASLLPDVVHITSLFEGFVDNAVTGVGGYSSETPVSVTLYDLIPLQNPTQFLKPNPSYEIFYRRKLDQLTKANLFLAISKFSASDALKTLNLPSAAVIPVMTAIEEGFEKLPISDSEKKKIYAAFGITKPFLLYTGGCDAHKNLARLITAFSQLPDRIKACHQLVFAGRMPKGEVIKLQEHACMHGLTNENLVFTGYITDRQLVILYNICKLFVFPSWQEGFGLPPLEAMACGAPVIASNSTSLVEVMNWDDATFDPFREDAITAKMLRALEDQDYRSALRRNGARQARSFSWDKTAKKTLQAWSEYSANKCGVPRKSVISKNPGKARLAFVSPLPPERTGIANYSWELLPFLTEYYEVFAVCEFPANSTSKLHPNLQIRSATWLRNNANTIDRFVYQMGNSPFHKYMLDLIADFPGTVVLHDFFLSSLFSWCELQAGLGNLWIKELYSSHGYPAVRLRFTDIQHTKEHYPVNWYVLANALGVIVHSRHAAELGRKWYAGGDRVQWDSISHLRKLKGRERRSAARKALGLNDSDFLVCSFGFIDATKLNHKLLEAWCKSALSQSFSCYLTFVGENEGGQYGDQICSQIKQIRGGGRIKITGFAADDVYQQYLSAADLAIQLRTSSRGETSGSVLDCMSHGVPLIVNGHGSMCELDKSAVWMLPDQFTVAELCEAIERLWSDAALRRTKTQQEMQVIRDRHSGEKCAKAYFDAIEKHYGNPNNVVPAIVSRLGSETVARFGDAEIVTLATSVAQTFPVRRPSKRLVLDITATHRTTRLTGIERVVRELLSALIDDDTSDLRIEPVFLSKHHGQWCHRFARKYTLQLMNCPREILEDEVYDPASGDILLVLDAAGETLVQATESGLFNRYRNLGVKVYTLVHDLLPVRMPQAFPEGASETHARWLAAVDSFDGIIGVSHATARDYQGWKSESGLSKKARLPFSIGWSHHGADFDRKPSCQLSAELQNIMTLIKTQLSFVSVGTIEPRKGYLQLIRSFDLLWREGVEAILVIVGNEGWVDLPDEMRRDIPETIRRIREHPKLGKQLYWLENANDCELKEIYQSASCLISTSYGEGFGLPIVEAMHYGLPVLARDLEVFREITGDRAQYFHAKSPHELASTIKKWLAEVRGTTNALCGYQSITWKQSAASLKEIVTRMSLPSINVCSAEEDNPPTGFRNSCSRGLLAI